MTDIQLAYNVGSIVRTLPTVKPEVFANRDCTVRRIEDNGEVAVTFEEGGNILRLAWFRQAELYTPHHEVLQP